MKTEEEIRTRPVRRPRSELKQLVLQGAVDILHRADLVLSLDSLSYVRVFEYLKESQGVTVTRGSVHERIWSSVEDFRFDALLHALDEPEFVGYQQMEVAIGEILSSSDLTSQGGRSEALIRITRDAIPRYEKIEHQSERWKVLGLQVLASMPDRTSGPAMELTERLAANDRYWEDRFVEQFASMFETLELHARPELGLDQETAMRTFSQWATDINRGRRLYEKGTMAHRSGVTCTSTSGPEQWSSYGLACFGFVQQLFEQR